MTLMERPQKTKRARAQSAAPTQHRGGNKQQTTGQQVRRNLGMPQLMPASRKAPSASQMVAKAIQRMQRAEARG